MSTKIIRSIIAIVVVLAVGFVALWFFDQSPKSTGYFAPFRASDLQEIRIDNDTGVIDITKKGGMWFVEPYLADQEWVDGLIAGILSVQEGEIVSGSLSSHIQYGVTDTAVRVVLTTKDDGKWLFFGNPGPVRGSHYIRSPDSSDVYLTDAPVYIFLQQPWQYWRSKEIFSVKPKQIDRIEVVRYGTMMNLEQEKGTWTASLGDQKVVLPDGDGHLLADSFNPLNAIGFLDTRQAFEVREVDDTALVSVFHGKDIETFNLWNNGEEWWLTYKDNGFIVPDAFAANLPLDPSVLFPEEEEAPTEPAPSEES